MNRAHRKEEGRRQRSSIRESERKEGLREE